MKNFKLNKDETFGYEFFIADLDVLGCLKDSIYGITIFFCYPYFMLTNKKDYKFIQYLFLFLNSIINLILYPFILIIQIFKALFFKKNKF